MDFNGSLPSVINISDKRKVSAKMKALRIMDLIILNMYSDVVLSVMDKEGFSTEESDIEEAKKSTKNKLMITHLDGRTTKQISGSISELMTLLKFVRFNNRVLRSQPAQEILS